jgi:hypothetical protein
VSEIQPSEPPAVPSDPDKEGRLDDFFQGVIEQAPPYLAEIMKASTGLAGDLVAVAAPHFASLVLTYRQKRAERNMALLFKELKDRSGTIEERLGKLEAAYRDDVRVRIFPALLDYVHGEAEEEKVPLFAAGFSVALAHQNKPGPSVLFMQYAELLSQLSRIEVRVLTDLALRYLQRPSGPSDVPGFPEYFDARGLTEQSFKLIQEKLHRFRLLEDENEDSLREQVELHDDLLLQLTSTSKSSGGRPSRLGSYGKPYSPRYRATGTAENLLEFCELKADQK